MQTKGRGRLLRRLTAIYAGVASSVASLYLSCLCPKPQFAGFMLLVTLALPYIASHAAPRLLSLSADTSAALRFVASVIFTLSTYTVYLLGAVFAANLVRGFQVAPFAWGLVILGYPMATVVAVLYGASVWRIWMRSSQTPS